MEDLHTELASSKLHKPIKSSRNIMKNFTINSITLAIGLVFSFSAAAESMTKAQLKAHEKNIQAEYKVALAACDSLSGNANDICVAEAKGNKSIALAESEASYKPSAKTHYNVNAAKADADYEVAIQKCDDKAGNAKDVCVKEAKAVNTHQMSDAKLKMKSSEANAAANEKSSDANANAAEIKTEAHKDANAENRDADYVVAKEKCDALAGSAKDLCMSNAKSKFGK